MQDPLFQLVKEDSTSLDSFFNQNLGLGLGSPTNQSTTPGQNGIATDSAEMPPQAVEMYEKNTPEPDVLPEADLEEITSLEDRIKVVQKEYNDTPIAIYGKVLSNKLLTMAAKLRSCGKTSAST